MEFGLSETQQLLKNSAREFLAAECPIAEVRRVMETDTAHDPALWKKMGEQGWTGLHIAEEHGGMGLGLVELAAACEEMGRALLPGPFLSTVPLAATLLASVERGDLLAPICQGEKLATVALLESTASWDLDAVKMPAAPLRGTKLFVPGAAEASLILCVARAGSELALLAVDRNAAGLIVTPMPALDMTRRLYAVSFSDVQGEVLATGERVTKALRRALDVATVALVAEMAGGMQRILDITVSYAKTRKQFGRVIGQFQAVQHMCADMLLWTESTRSAAYYAAWALDQQTPEAAAAVSVAKSYASDAYREAGNRAIQVHGGMGFTWENDVHLYYRRAKASELAFGDAAFHRERIARLVIDR